MKRVLRLVFRAMTKCIIRTSPHVPGGLNAFQVLDTLDIKAGNEITTPQPNWH